MRQKICRRTLFKYIGSKFGLQHQHQRLAVVGRDCTRRCRQCLCPRAAGAAPRADGRALCALSISHWAVLYSSKLRTLLPRRKVSPGWKACAGLGLADAATEGSNDKQGELIVSQQMRLQITPTGFMHPMLYRNVIYLGRPLGHINPSSSRGQVAFGHLKAQHFMLQ